MDCMKELVENFDAEQFEEKQTQLRESYEELEEFLDGLNAMAEIEDSLLTVDPQSKRGIGVRSRLHKRHSGSGSARYHRRHSAETDGGATECDDGREQRACRSQSLPTLL